MWSRKNILFICILAIAGFLRFYNLMFDAPYFFNPDERNMASAITQFQIPQNLNPNFFAYGQFPLYLAFFSDQATQFLTTYNIPARNATHSVAGGQSTTFYNAIFWLRFYSALSSVLTVFLVFSIAKKLLTHNLALLTAAFVAFTPGLIQAAHFGTTESLLTFFLVGSVYCAFRYLNKPSTKYIILGSVLAGLALGTKLTGIFCIVPLLLSLCIACIKQKKDKNLHPFLLMGKHILVLFIVTAGIAILSSPYNLIDFNNFKSAVFGYESDVATGKYKAFYTVQFLDSVAFLYQAKKVFPYTLGWPLFILGTAGLLLIVVKFKKEISRTYYIVLIASFLIYLIPNAVLFTKWTRFTTPIIPFFSISATYFLYYFSKNCLPRRNHTTTQESRLWEWRVFCWGLIVTMSLVAVVPGIAFMSIYTKIDTRFKATEWIYKNIPNHTTILSETGNVIDIPLYRENKDYNVISFDFYHLDENPDLYESLLRQLEISDYILIPSRRIFTNYTKFPNRYPLLSRYYDLLFSGKLGFQKIKEFTSYPSLYPIQFPDEDAEETWTVFDHPIVRIYKKTKSLDAIEYKHLLEKQ